MYTGFWWGNLRERGHFKGLGILILIKMDLQKMGCGDMRRIELAQDTDRYRALVNAIMNSRAP